MNKAGRNFGKNSDAVVKYSDTGAAARTSRFRHLCTRLDGSPTQLMVAGYEVHGVDVAEPNIVERRFAVHKAAQKFLAELVRVTEAA